MNLINPNKQNTKSDKLFQTLTLNEYHGEGLNNLEIIVQLSDLDGLFRHLLTVNATFKPISTEPQAQTATPDLWWVEPELLNILKTSEKLSNNTNIAHDHIEYEFGTIKKLPRIFSVVKFDNNEVICLLSLNILCLVLGLLMLVIRWDNIDISVLVSKIYKRKDDSGEVDNLLKKVEK